MSKIKQIPVIVMYDLLECTCLYGLFIHSVFAICLHTLGKQQSARLAYCISVLGSSILSIVSTAYIITRIWQYGLGAFILVGDDVISKAMAMFYMMILMSDIFWGLQYYPQHFELLSGWVHHIAYIVILYYIFIFGVSRGFALCCLEEIPTLILGLGRIFPTLRNDVGFGATFFVFRVVYHGILTIVAFATPKVPWIFCWFFVAAFGLHMYWFKNWAAKYGAKLWR